LFAADSLFAAGTTKSEVFGWFLAVFFEVSGRFPTVCAGFFLAKKTARKT
jgi:hypothetical protein